MKNFICSCCGSYCTGKQWWNQDLHYGLCPECIPKISKVLTEREMQQNYGFRGVHYDLDYVKDPNYAFRGPDQMF